MAAPEIGDKMFMDVGDLNIFIVCFVYSHY